MKSKPWIFSIILAITSVASFFMPWFKLIGSASYGGQSVSSSTQFGPSDLLIVYSPWIFLSVVSAVLAILKSRFAFIPALLNFYPILSFLGLFGKGLGLSVSSSGASAHAEYKLIYGYWVFAITTIFFIVAILVKKGGNEVNLNFILKLFKRTLIVVLAFCILVGIAIITFSYFGVSEEGVMHGRVTSLNEEGIIIKTFEGKLSLQAYGALNSVNTITESFSFSVDNSKTDVIKELQQALLNEEQINLHFVKRYLKFPWRGDTKYFVESIERNETVNSNERKKVNQLQKWNGTYMYPTGYMLTIEVNGNTIKGTTDDGRDGDVTLADDGKVRIEGEVAFLRNDTIFYTLHGAGGSTEVFLVRELLDMH